MLRVQEGRDKSARNMRRFDETLVILPLVGVSLLSEGSHSSFGPHRHVQGMAGQIRLQNHNCRLRLSGGVVCLLISFKGLLARLGSARRWWNHCCGGGRRGDCGGGWPEMRRRIGQGIRSSRRRDSSRISGILQGGKGKYTRKWL